MTVAASRKKNDNGLVLCASALHKRERIERERKRERERERERERPFYDVFKLLWPIAVILVGQKCKNSYFSYKINIWLQLTISLGHDAFDGQCHQQWPRNTAYPSFMN